MTNAGAKLGAAGVGRGIAADSRTANQYWVWMAGNEGWIVRIPGSDIKMLKMDQTIAGDDYFAYRVAGNSISGAGVDREQNVWSVATSGSVATRARAAATKRGGAGLRRRTGRGSGPKLVATSALSRRGPWA